MRKLAIVTPTISRQAGGLFLSVRGLARALACLPQTEINVLAIRDPFSEEDAHVWQPLRPQLFSTRGPAAFRYAPALSHRLLESLPDLVHVQGLWLYPSVADLNWRRASARPYFISPRGMLDAWALANSQLKKRIAAWLFEAEHLANAACLHALCEAEARSIRAYGLSNPVCVIPNGVDLPEPVSNWNGKTQSLGIASSPAERKVLLYLGRLHPKKGLLNLLRAWRLALNRRPSIRERWVLSIAGWDENGHESELKRLADDLEIRWTAAADGAQAAECKDRAKQLETLGHGSVIFSGPQFGEAKSESYRGCDAFILPSFSEGLPMVVLEAWSYARTVLMTPECHLPQGFSAGAALRTEANVESIAAALLQLSEMSDNERTAMGHRGLDLVRDQFAWPEIAKQMRQAYEWVLGGGEKPGFVV